MAAVVGLSASTILFGPSQPEVVHPPQQIQTQNHELPPVFVPDYSFDAAKLADRHVVETPSPAALPAPSTARPETKVLSYPAPESAEKLPTSPYSPDELAKKIKYVRSVLLPLLKKTGLQVKISDAGLIAPGEFRLFGRNNCDVQFYVNSAASKLHYNIVEETWGEDKWFRRSVFRRAVYTHGMLSHAESNSGYFFASNRPVLAAQYAVRTYALLCHVEPSPRH